MILSHVYRIALLLCSLNTVHFNYVTLASHSLVTSLARLVTVFMVHATLAWKDSIVIKISFCLRNLMGYSMAEAFELE